MKPHCSDTSMPPSLVFECLVQFVYANQTTSSGAFAVPTLTSVELIPTSRAAARVGTPEQSSARGLRFSAVTSPLNESSADKHTNALSRDNVDDDAPRWNVVWEKTNRRPQEQQQSPCRSSTVRAVRRVCPPDKANASNGAGTSRASASSFMVVSHRSSQSNEPPRIWLPFSVVDAIDCHFSSSRTKYEYHTMQPTNRTSGAQVSISVRPFIIPSASSADAAGASASPLSRIYLFGVPYKDALALAAAQEASVATPQANGAPVQSRRAATPSSASTASAQTSAISAAHHCSHFQDPAQGISIGTMSRDAPRSSREDCVESPSPLPTVEPHRPSHKVRSPDTRKMCGFVTVPTTSEHHGSEHPTLTQETRSDSVTTSLQQANDTSVRDRDGSSGEAAAYNKYARLIGAAVPPSARDKERTAAPTGQTFTSESLQSSVASTVMSIPHSMQPASERHSKNSGGAAQSPPCFKDVRFVFPDGPLTDAGDHTAVHASRSRDDGRPPKPSGGVVPSLRKPNFPAHLTLPSVVDSSSAFGHVPRWFPAALELSNVSASTSPGSSPPRSLSSASAALPSRSLSPEEGSTWNVSSRASSTMRGRGSSGATRNSRDVPNSSLVPRVKEDAGEATRGAAPGKVLVPAAASAVLQHAPLLSTSRATPSPTSLVASPTSPLSPKASENKDRNILPHLQYLTDEQRQLVDFDRLLRPVVAPPASGGAAVAPTRSLSSSFPAAPARVTAAGAAFDGPAMLQEVLLRLRTNSLPKPRSPASPVRRESPKSAGPVAVPVRSWSSPLSVTVSGASKTPATATAVASTSKPSDPNGEMSTIAPDESRSQSLLSTYRAMLQQMCDRQTYNHPPPRPTSPARFHTEASLTASTPAPDTITPPVTAAVAASAAAHVLTPLTAKSEKSPLQLVTFTAADTNAKKPVTSSGSAQPQQTGSQQQQQQPSPLEKNQTPIKVSVTTDFVPRESHGPFAQPTQHPPSTFLAHGGFRSASLRTPSPYRPRRLTSQPVDLPMPVVVHERELATPNIETSTSNHSCSNQNTSSADSAATSSLQREESARLRRGNLPRSPQPSQHMLPRRPRPLIGTPKLGFDDLAAAEPVSPPMLLDTSLHSDATGASSTSMAT